jgi:OmcA/MtrC family decaheme c-type cytochrome
MVTAAFGIDYNGFVQIDNTSYPNGIRLREPAFAMVTATGKNVNGDANAARRAIVDNAKCNSCHGQLGVDPTFHGGARNNGAGCAICHDANRATSHTGSGYFYGGGWSVSSKNLVHSIHASKKRAQAFNYEATFENPNGFKEVTYPGVLKDCQQCHVAGSYDFSAAVNKAALSNLQWTTEAKKDMSIPSTTVSADIVGLSPWVGATPGATGMNFTNDNLVSSPLTSSCFGCHDSKDAVAHMRSNGGTVYGLVSTVSNGVTRPAVGTDSTFSFTKVESCAVCHAAGKNADIAVVHK